MMRRVGMTLVSGAAVLMLSGAPASAAFTTTRALSATSVRELSSLYRASPQATSQAPRRHGSPPEASTAIVGGSAIKQGQLAYAAFVVYFDPDGNAEFACSGTVISANVVLTAAHCATDETTLEPVAPDGFRVLTGAVDWSDTANRQVSLVNQVIVNPSYVDVTDIADAALLVLQRPITAPAIRLAANTERYLYTPGMPAATAGWGIDETGTASTVLQAATTTLQSEGYCSQFDDLFSNFWQTCAVQAPGFASGVCAGDSGGPLLTIDVDNRPVQIGVTDAGPKDCNTTTANFFARSNALFSWAKSAVASVAPPGARPMTATPDHPVAPTLTLGDVRSYATTMVKERTHKRSRVSVSCARISTWKLRCELRWKANSASYTAQGTFWHFLRGGTAHWSYDVTGRLTRRSCTTAGRCRTVHQRFRWRPYLSAGSAQ